MRRTRLPDPPVNGGVGYPLGCVAAVTVTVGAVAAHVTGHPLWSVVVLSVVTTAVAAVTTLPAAVATAAVCWALHAGFVLGRQGDLQFSPASAGAAGVLVAAAVVAHAVGLAVRAGLRPHRPTSVAVPAPRVRPHHLPVGRHHHRQQHHDRELSQG